MEIEVVLEAAATIGKSPTWDPNEKALYWIDVKKPALHRYDPETGEQRAWRMSSDIGAFALTTGPAGPLGAVVALRQGIFRLNFGTGLLIQLTNAPFDPTLFRFNEGTCDAAGRFWVGVMFDPLDPAAPHQQSSLHSFTLRGGLRAERDSAELHNGMAWSADGRRFFLSHSRQGDILSYAFDLAAGQLGAPSLFARIPRSLGLPDGAAVDSEGGYWCALYGASRLRRFTATGVVDRDVELPVSQPTMCAFAGADLDTLYVTSAVDGLGVDQRQREPLAGGLFRFRPGLEGIPRPCFVR